MLGAMLVTAWFIYNCSSLNCQSSSVLTTYLNKKLQMCIYIEREIDNSFVLVQWDHRVMVGSMESTSISWCTVHAHSRTQRERPSRGNSRTDRSCRGHWCLRRRSYAWEETLRRGNHRHRRWCSTSSGRSWTSNSSQVRWSGTPGPPRLLTCTAAPELCSCRSQ